MPTLHKEIADNILRNDATVKEDLNLIKNRFMLKGYTQQWETAPLDYVQYLMAYVVGQTLGVKTSPPLHVDELWHIHLLETKSYRHLEQKVIQSIKVVDPDLNIEHIDHSVVHNMDGGRNERLKATRKLYRHLGFEFLNYKEEEEEEADLTPNIHGRGGKRQRETSNVAVGSITLIVKDQAGEETYFRVKRSARLGKVFNGYAAQKGMQADDFRFLWDGERIKPYHTPEAFEMDDHDVITALLEQRGC